MIISILIVTEYPEKWIEKMKEDFHGEKVIIQRHGTSYYYVQIGKEIEIKFYITRYVYRSIVRGRKINHVILDKKIDEEESRLVEICLIGNEVKKTDNWFNEVYNESKL